MNRYALASLYVELTAHCFYKCPYCYIECHAYQESSLKLDSVKCLLSQARQLGCTTVVFSGGEPLLLTETIRMIQEARKLGFCFIELDSNCYLMDKETALGLKGAVSCVRINMPFAHKEKYDECVGVRGAFERVLEGISTLLDERIPVVFQSVIFGENLNELESILQLAESVGLNKVMSTIDKVIFTGVIPTGKAKELTMLSGRQYKRLSKKLRQMSDFYKIAIGNGIETKPVKEMLKLYPVCTALSHRALTVKPNGNLSVCPWTDNNTLTFLGNFERESLKNIVKRIALIEAKLKGLNDYFVAKHEKELNELVPLLHGRCQKCIEWRTLLE